MISGIPGISSYDMFSIGRTIKSELKTLGGNLLGLNSAVMKLSNGDDDERAGIDPRIGAREVTTASRRRIGGPASSKLGGLGPKSTPARTANILGNPYMRRYEDPGSATYRFGLSDAPAIGEYYDVYESENHRVRFLDETVGRDLLGYTHLENAASERSGDAINDNIYLRSTYSVFGDLNYPFDVQDIETFRLGPKRYSPSEPYVLKPLESQLVRQTMNGNVQGFRERFEAVVSGREPYYGSLIDMWDYMGSNYYLNILNGVGEYGLFVENYQYDQKNRTAVYDMGSVPQSDYPYFLNVDTISPEKEIKGLLGKTNRMFHDGKIRSLVNRFATLTGDNEGMPGFLNTATDHLYGLSRGRNLRKLNLTYENSYPNPYCRVWTTHYQYSKYKHLIRGKWADASLNAGTDHYTLHEKDELMRPNKGYARLKAMTSLDSENGKPIFSPYYVNDRSELEKDSIKRCMFSIENLAWKDIIPSATLVRRMPDGENVLFNRGISWSDNDTSNLLSIKDYRGHMAKGFGTTLTEEQVGPNGGRIMWFPPYNLKFTEQTSAQWNDNTFIGRGEKIYSYVNSERTGTLSFTILVDHPSIINEWARGGKMGKTGNKVSPLSKDEMILRYFAGCDSLEFNPREEYDVPYSAISEYNTIIEENQIDVPVIKKVPKAKVAEKNTDNNEAMTFYSVFYFPNNYSAADFMGQEVSSPDSKGTLTNRIPMSNQKHRNDYKLGLQTMFETGKRSEGVGYERGNGESSTGMTYDGQYYATGYSKHNGQKVIRKWFYPVDSRVKNEDLVHGNDSYKDMHDYGLNADFYGDFWKDIPDDGIVEYLNEGNSLTSSQNLEIAKSYVGLGGEDKNKYLVPAYNFYKNLEKVIRGFNKETGGDKYRYEIEIQGFASEQGYSTDSAEKPRYLVRNDVESNTIDIGEDAKSNEILAENRAAVIEGWIRSLGIFDFDGRDKISHIGNGHVNGTLNGSESDFKPKAARAAVVKLHIIPEEKDITEVQEFEDVTEMTKKDVITSREEYKEYEVFDTSNSDKYENQTYDNEYAYFKQINENDDMVKRYISDKVDYFDPAFHSITPEGFNARLTFLQQCTRQGPTISVSDLHGGGNYGAGNLSFGRAPYCVLRIGDFYNTKICIQNINIEYDNGGGVQWDMNPEGVGLQPMLANVNITFSFVGGSDISGPIARLQNAASFNFYANTSVYDRRADYRNGFISKEDDTAMSWSPVILNKDEAANITEHRKFRTTLEKETSHGEKNNLFGD